MQESGSYLWPLPFMLKSYIKVWIILKIHYLSLKRCENSIQYINFIYFYTFLFGQGINAQFCNLKTDTFPLGRECKYLFRQDAMSVYSPFNSVVILMEEKWVQVRRAFSPTSAELLLSALRVAHMFTLFTGVYASQCT